MDRPLSSKTVLNGSSAFIQKYFEWIVCFDSEISIVMDRPLWPRIVCFSLKSQFTLDRPLSSDRLLWPKRSSALTQKIVCFNPLGSSAFVGIVCFRRDSSKSSIGNRFELIVIYKLFRKCQLGTL